MLERLDKQRMFVAVGIVKARRGETHVLGEIAHRSCFVAAAPEARDCGSSAAVSSNSRGRAIVYPALSASRSRNGRAIDINVSTDTKLSSRARRMQMGVLIDG